MWRTAEIVIRVESFTAGKNSDRAGAMIEVLRQQIDRRAGLRLVAIGVAVNKTVLEDNVIGPGPLSRVIASVYMSDARAWRLKIHRIARGSQLCVIVLQVPGEHVRPEG